MYMTRILDGKTEHLFTTQWPDQFQWWL